MVSFAPALNPCTPTPTELDTSIKPRFVSAPLTQLATEFVTFQ